ncbi:hypothetical protein M885DRAFT_333373 [Pelagophyceae sp. CCMP2097]|nr:hypothetical protein M885DRAFT_333373 [Pelagophyceae sp. CCMP2097]|mmetsp:Transcript_583/g.2129  ORF Transcript_583/g.2129 Transcript_583/m.2129 type:complete len:381 (+) Transcript_583:557-1699(+)
MRLANRRSRLRRSSGLGAKSSGPLFLSTEGAGRAWRLPIEKLEQAAHDLLDERLGKRSPTFEVLTGELQRCALREAGEVAVADVDGFLLILLRHWALAVDDRRRHAFEASKTSLVFDGGAAAAMQTKRGFEQLRGALKIAEAAAPKAPTEKQASDLAQTSTLVAYKLSCARAWRRDVASSAAYAKALRDVEGGGAVKLDVAKACENALDAISFEDMRADWVAASATTADEGLIFDGEASARLLYEAWDAYQQPMDLFMDLFEADFANGHEPALEEARALHASSRRALDKLREQDGKAGKRSQVVRLGQLTDRWAALRLLLDKVHRLRLVQAAVVAVQLLGGEISEDDVDKDLVTQIGWTSSSEFIRDAWTSNSPDAVWPT